LRPPKRRPITFCEVELGVRRLPKQKIGDPKLTTRPDEQVRIRDPRSREPPRDGRLVDVLDVGLASYDALGQLACGPGQLPPPAVGQRKVEGHPRSRVGGLSHRKLE